LITTQKNKDGDSCKANLVAWFGDKKGNIQDAIFIYWNVGHAKADKPRKNEAKTAEMESGQKQVVNYILSINFIA